MGIKIGSNLESLRKNSKPKNEKVAQESFFAASARLNKLRHTIKEIK